MSFSSGPSAADQARQAEEARQAEAARLAQQKAAEDARILKDTLANKTAQANKESSSATARTALMAKGKTALEDPTEENKKKTLLQNYSA